MTNPAHRLIQVVIAVLIGTLSVNVFAQRARPIDPDKARVVEYWTKERRAAAIPRDLVIDERGLGYLRRPDGSLQPYGHQVAAQEAPRAATPIPFAKPGGGGKADTRPPSISSMNPSAGATIGTTHTFSAVVKDSGGVASVEFAIWQGTFSGVWATATLTSTDTYTLVRSGLAVGDWNWQVRGTDNATNSKTSSTVAFKVSDGAVPVADATWPYPGSSIQKAAGRLYFEMPANRSKTRWSGYVCSGTVATDGANDRSIIVTAAHCVYDDSNGSFARNILFIPNQAGTGTATDLNCSNDVMGCWVPSFGVVHFDWTNVVWPSNIEWDYGYYVVNDAGSHTGSSTPFTSTKDPTVLDSVAGSFPISFAAPSTTADFEYALGYSYSQDPLFRYCSENMTTDPNSSVDWWLGSCLLSGGSSGGPWIQPTSTGWNGEGGSIITVNSYGYTNSPGMAGAKLANNNARSVFCAAKNADLLTSQGLIVLRGADASCP